MISAKANNVEQVPDELWHPVITSFLSLRECAYFARTSKRFCGLAFDPELKKVGSCIGVLNSYIKSVNCRRYGAAYTCNILFALGAAAVTSVCTREAILRRNHADILVTESGRIPGNATSTCDQLYPPLGLDDGPGYRFCYSPVSSPVTLCKLLAEQICGLIRTSDNYGTGALLTGILILLPVLIYLTNIFSRQERCNPGIYNLNTIQDLPFSRLPVDLKAKINELIEKYQLPITPDTLVGKVHKELAKLRERLRKSLGQVAITIIEPDETSDNKEENPLLTPLLLR